jgi:hypothetical protein
VKFQDKGEKQHHTMDLRSDKTNDKNVTYWAASVFVLLTIC